MPQSTTERRKRWGIEEDKAIAFLEEKGYVLTSDWFWYPPNRKQTEEELDAIIFLIEEWDFGGLRIYRKPLTKN